MRFIVCLLLAMAPASLAFALAPAPKADSAWAVDYDSFYEINLATRQARFVGPVGPTGPQPLVDLSGLTITTDGTMYAASDAVKGLIRIDPATGSGSLVGHFGIPQADPSAPLDFAMTASCDGDLWLSSPVTRELWRVNPASGRATRVGGMGRDIVGLVARGAALYGVGGRGEEGWYEINPDSGRARLIGGLGSMVDYVASASPLFRDDGSVLAALNYVPLPGGVMPPDWSDLVRIDPESGVAQMLGTIEGAAQLRGIGVRGLAAAPPICAAAPPPGVPPVTAVGVPTLGAWARWLLALALIGAALPALRAPGRGRSRQQLGP